ncbi:MAG TPA: enoyl-CoA hydratase/isomerase family protein [Terriglobales bacterium]|nr:enoyl-CoA hydratase/isomerase family protein [Terriglobales bacterium]
MGEIQPASSRVVVEREASIARLILSNGKQNIIDFQMMDELAFALHDLEQRPEISTILVSTAGEHFSNGVDIPSHTPDKVVTMLEKFDGAIRRLVKTSKVTLAAVKGYCLGGGAELAMVCDIVITTDGAHWGFPEIRLGCFPPVAAAALAAIVGQKLAAELVLTGRTFDGREAERIGFASRAVPADKLKQTVAEYIEGLTALSPVALMHAKRALYAWDAAHFEKGLGRAEQIYLKELIKTEDAQEGIRAWMEKRKPKWMGR